MSSQKNSINKVMGPVPKHSTFWDRSHVMRDRSRLYGTGTPRTYSCFVELTGYTKSWLSRPIITASVGLTLYRLWLSDRVGAGVCCTVLLVHRFVVIQIEILNWKGINCHVIWADTFSKLVFHVKIIFSKPTFKEKLPGFFKSLQVHI